MVFFENLLEKLKLDFVTILMNLKIINQAQNKNQNSNSDIADNPKCLLILKKIRKFQEMIDVKQPEKKVQELLWCSRIINKMIIKLLKVEIVNLKFSS